MALLTWLSDHALILLLGCGTLFNVYWLHRCRERLHLRWLSVLLLSVLHTGSRRSQREGVCAV